MSLSSIISYFVLMGAFAGIASLFEKSSPAQWRPNLKNLPLEGLRGILALSVFFHHFAVSQGFWTTGYWQPPGNYFYAQLGPIPVLLFFYLSGYLFWKKLLDQEGKLDLLSFFSGRVRRLAPAYYFSLFLVVFIVFLQEGFRLRVPFQTLFQQVLHWASFSVPYGFLPDINGFVGTARINCAVTWTLRFEWLFYLFLPLLAWFSIGKRLFLLLLSSVLSYAVLKAYFFAGAALTQESGWLESLILAFLTYLASGFGMGMLTAYLEKKEFIPEWFCQLPGMLLCCGCLGLVLLIDFPLGSVTKLLLNRLLLLIVFASVVRGQDFFGILRKRGFQQLGKISYSVYLLHGVVLYCGFTLFRKYLPLEKLSAMEYGVLAFLCGVSVLLLSYLSYQWFEAPFLRSKIKSGKEVLSVGSFHKVADKSLFL